MREAIERSPTDDAVVVFGNEDGKTLGMLVAPLRELFTALGIGVQRRDAVFDPLIINTADRLGIGRRRETNHHCAKAELWSTRTSFIVDSNQR